MLQAGAQSAQHATSSIERYMDGSVSEKSAEPQDELMANTNADFILIFLECLVSETAERILDNVEVHLLFLSKEQVYEVFHQECSIFHHDTSVQMFSCFTATWKRD